MSQTTSPPIYEALNDQILPLQVSDIVSIDLAPPGGGMLLCRVAGAEGRSVDLQLLLRAELIQGLASLSAAAASRLSGGRPQPAR